MFLPPSFCLFFWAPLSLSSTAGQAHKALGAKKPDALSWRAAPIRGKGGASLRQLKGQADRPTVFWRCLSRCARSALLFCVALDPSHGVLNSVPRTSNALVAVPAHVQKEPVKNHTEQAKKTQKHETTERGGEGNPNTDVPNQSKEKSLQLESPAAYAQTAVLRCCSLHASCTGHKALKGVIAYLPNLSAPRKQTPQHRQTKLT